MGPQHITRAGEVEVTIHELVEVNTNLRKEITERQRAEDTLRESGHKRCPGRGSRRLVTVPPPSSAVARPPPIPPLGRVPNR